MKKIYQILFTLFITLNTSWALDQFACECKATGPGYEATNKQTGGDVSYPDDHGREDCRGHA